MQKKKTICDELDINHTTGTVVTLTSCACFVMRDRTVNYQTPDAKLTEAGCAFDAF
ncbi:hypothetical protein U1Q18_020636 [Sarracenia purpurea var. burkii]